MVDLIIAKRNGKEHSREEIKFIINSVMDGSTPDYQLAAWLMAVCWRGMTMDEVAWLTDAMAHSGQVLDLSSIGKVVGDKHSTGGVGDKTTLVFVPMLAAVGIPMAKLSGRGLGHTGGTIDKLEAIPGFNTGISIDSFIAQVKRIGAAIAGQTQELAPADGKMYALRDVTGTVESLPLIAASVVSKKVAAGSNLIILDVKCGAGAFMATQADAEALAKTMVEIGKRLGRPVSAVVTDMEQPLGFAVGHTIEVIEAIETLRGAGPEDLRELCLSLGSLAMVAAGKCKSESQAREQLVAALSNGQALKKFAQLIEAQGGNPAVIEDYSLMPQSKLLVDFMAPAGGTRWVKRLDGRKVAEACKLMGAGRAKKGDPINLAVGVVLKAKVGSKVEGDQSLATIYADSEEQAALAETALMQAFEFSDTEVAVPPVIRARAGVAPAAVVG
ncbi:MAG TPA: thymidine phosphorylase [Candidatus Obscuribacterales bacterium]